MTEREASKSMVASLEEVCTHDHDRFLTLLFAPSAKRPALTALYAFNIEIARVAEAVTEPMMGHIRLQWWRETLEGLPRGETRGHAAAEALHEAGGIPLDKLQALIDARERDLSEDAFPDMSALEDYAVQTSSALMTIAAEILAGWDAARNAALPIRHAGIAYALTGILRALPVHASHGRLLLPADILGRHEVDPHDVLAGRMTEGLRAAMHEVAGAARTHLAAARSHTVEPTLIPALLPASLCDRHLDIMSAREFDPFRNPVEVPAFRRQLRLLGRSLLKRI
ncbi:phytoene/squalene synthase family protein [Parvibaculum sp.]|uniref:phytoene/squalene synthase family protein n=1 Tax=Parvibaculum sp. TaxID=2024848 RepID=UPI00391D396C